MTDMTLLPTSGFGGEAGAAALGGGLGGLIGSWFGNGWGGNGWNGNGRGVAGVELQNTVDTTAILSAINANTLAAAQGFGSVNTTTERAAASSYSGLTQQNTQNLLASVQGFAGLNTAIMQGTNQTVGAINAADVNALSRSYQAQLAAEKCCCETNLNIEREGNKTRDLMRQQFADSQAVLICDLKSRLQEAHFANSQLAQTAQLNCKINQVEQLVNFKIPTPPTPPTGCC